MRVAVAIAYAVALVVLAGCTPGGAKPSVGAVGIKDPQGSPVSTRLTASAVASNPVPPAEGLLRTATDLYPDPLGDGQLPYVVAAGSRVPVLGRTDGALAAALC